MKAQSIKLQLVEIIIFAILGYFIFLENGWALATSVTLIGISVIEILNTCRHCGYRAEQNAETIHGHINDVDSRLRLQLDDIESRIE